MLISSPHGQAPGLPRSLPRSVYCALILLCAPAQAADPVAATQAELRAALRRSAEAPRPPHLPRGEFLRRPAVFDVQLSPDGRQLSFRQRKAQQTEVLVQDLASGRQRRVLADTRRLETAWSGDGRRLWLADDGGLAVHDAASGAARRILKWDARRRQRFWGVDAHAVADALITEKLGRDGAWVYRTLRVDASGKTQLLHEGAQPLRGALLNADGSLAYTAAYDGPGWDTVIRKHEASGSRELLRCTGAEQCGLVGHSRARGELWLLSHHGEDKLALMRWRQGRWQTVHRDPAGLADAAAVLWQEQPSDWLAIAYHSDRRHWHGRDAATTARLAALQRRLPQAMLELAASADGGCWLVRARRSDWEQDRYFLYEPQSERLRPLVATEQAAAFPPERLASATPLHYRARDGELVHGYVYLPLGVAAAKAPLAALIHGGPFNRDRDNYHDIAQMLANRGYAVFLPNYRASTGYGQRYLKAPQGDFGQGKPLTDIIDGLDFLLAQGIGDRDKQAVLGHSFGGYASLLAASHYPERFRFAAASAAPVDFGWVMKQISENGGSALPEDGAPGEIFLAHYGLPLGDARLKEKMRRESPLASLSRLRAPVYLWAGAKDDRVPLKSLTHYAGEARRQGKALSLLVDPASGHNPEQALAAEAIGYLYEAAAHRHFGGALTPPSAELEAFLRANLRLDGARLRH